MEIRYPAVAGMFYQADPQRLGQEIDKFLDTQSLNSVKLPQSIQPKALIVPHAGYIYSGAIAASGYKLLKPYTHQIKKVMLLGPSHRVAFSGIASSSANQFLTPLGEIPLDRQGIDKLNQLDCVHELDEAHAQEHSLEVQLPFLQKILPQFELIPLVVGQTSAAQVSQSIETFINDQQTLILISSDLSHYLDYETAKSRDQLTCRHIEQFNPDKIDYEDACGRLPVSGMLLSAQKHHLQVKTLDLRNSGDTAGSKDRVVGYGCWAFF